MPNVTAITDDKPSAGSGARVSRSTGRACVQLPGNGTLEARPHDGDRPAPLSGRLAADLVLGSGLFEQIAADMTRLDREIAAKPVDPAKALAIHDANRAAARVAKQIEAARKRAWAGYKKAKRNARISRQHSSA